MDDFLLALALAINILLAVLIALVVITRRGRNETGSRTYITALAVFGINIAALVANGLK